MTQRTNEFGQPIGPSMEHWAPPPAPPREAMAGRLCRLEPTDPARHARALYDANAPDDGRMWTYLPYGPFASFAEYERWINRDCLGDDPLFFTVIDLHADRPVGLVSYLRIQPAVGSIEVGHLNYSPALQRTAAATEAMHLMMARAFELGYRRYEWKCDALNAPSRRAAERLGFTYEGLFRNAAIYRNRSRDTAWYSIIDTEWPALDAAFRQWLGAGNFDAAGRQRTRLSDLTAAANRARA